MILTNTGGPIYFGRLEIAKGRNELSPEQAKDLLAGLEANPGWAHAFAEHERAKRLYEGEPKVTAPKANPAESAQALREREAREARELSEQLSKIEKMDAAEVDAQFARTTKPGPELDALVARMRFLAKQPAKQPSLELPFSLAKPPEPPTPPAAPSKPPGPPPPPPVAG